MNLESHLLPWERSQQKIDEIEITDEYFKNSQGCLRWKYIRSAYFNDFIDEDRVTKVYRKWRDQKEYLWLDGFDSNDKYITSFFVKASKRGNDVYKDRLKTKFNYLEQLTPLHFFTDWGVKQTPMLFITLTVDPKRFSLRNAWSTIAEELHVFESKLRQAYGPFVKLRVWESHESGFPHAHVVYYFHKTWFHVFNHKDKFRIAKKHKDSISNMWSMGNVDIQGVQDTLGAFKEVQKYVTKTIWNTKGDLTNAMLCLFRKQAYWLSSFNYKNKQREWIKQGKSMDEVFQLMNLNIPKWVKKDFIGAIWGEQAYLDLYKYLENGIGEDSPIALVSEYMHNCNMAILEISYFKYVGCVLHDDLLQFIPDLGDSWVLKADPPPELEGYLGFLYRDINCEYAKIYQCFVCGAFHRDKVVFKFEQCSPTEFFGVCPSCERESYFKPRPDLKSLGGDGL